MKAADRMDPTEGEAASTEMVAGPGSPPAVILSAVASHSEALSAMAALMTWMEHIEGHLILEQTLRVRWVPLEGTVWIDYATATSLELVYSPMGEQNSLWGTILATASDARRSSAVGTRGFSGSGGPSGRAGGTSVGTQTSTWVGSRVSKSWGTPMTRRLLRNSLLQPLADKSLLESRLTAVEELVRQDERRNELDQALVPLRSEEMDLDALTHRLLTIKKSRQQKHEIANGYGGSRGPHSGSTSASGAEGSAEDEFLIPPDPDLTDSRIQLILRLKAWLSHLRAVVEALQGVQSPLLVIIAKVRSDLFILCSCKLSSALYV